jgi:hypothetical protein
MQEMQGIFSHGSQDSQSVSNGSSLHSRASVPLEDTNNSQKSSQIFSFASDSLTRMSGGIRISDNGGNQSQFEAGFLPVIPISPKRQGIRISANGSNTGSIGTGFVMDPDTHQKGIKMVGGSSNRSHLESGLTLPPEEKGRGIRMSLNGSNSGHLDYGFLPQEDSRKSGGIRMPSNGGPNKSHFPSGFIPEAAPEKRLSGAGSARPGQLEFGSGSLTHHGEERMMKSKGRTSLSGSMSGHLSSDMTCPESPSKRSTQYADLVTKSAVFSDQGQPFRRLSHPSENGHKTLSSSIFSTERLNEVKQPTNRYAGAATMSHISNGFEISEPPSRPLNSSVHSHKMTESHFVLQGK